mmetsp:Transcript_42408/g.95717  ORF Transcript_42408/g.95717 Transcript_42408/m.95717 type:complete len:284 (-) Transcript_42408:25-876(-)
MDHRTLHQVGRRRHTVGAESLLHLTGGSLDRPAERVRITDASSQGPLDGPSIGSGVLHVGAGISAAVHGEDRALGLAATELGRVPVARSIAVAAVARNGCEVRSAVTVTTIVETKCQHVGDCAAELKAHLWSHFLTVLPGNDVGVVHNGHIGRPTQLVVVLSVTMRIAMDEQVVLNAVNVEEPVLEDGLEWLDGLWVHAGTWDLVEGQAVVGPLLPAVLLVHEHWDALHLRAAELRRHQAMLRLVHTARLGRDRQAQAGDSCKLRHLRLVLMLRWAGLWRMAK